MTNRCEGGSVMSCCYL